MAAVRIHTSLRKTVLIMVQNDSEHLTRLGYIPIIHVRLFSSSGSLVPTIIQPHLSRMVVPVCFELFFFYREDSLIMDSASQTITIHQHFPVRFVLRLDTRKSDKHFQGISGHMGQR
jgi:hypothetical protein